MSDHATTSAPASAEHEHGDQGHGGIGKYIVVFVALCMLTTASFLTYFPFWDRHVSDHVSWAFMMAVSCTKAMLVLMFFMHLLWEANWKYVLTIPAAMMSVFLVLMLVPDVGMRVENYSRERVLHAAVPEASEGHGAAGESNQNEPGGAESHEESGSSF